MGYVQMKLTTLTAGTLLLPLAACGEQASEEPSQVAESGQPERSFSGTGEITAIADGRVTIDHGPIAEIGWPAMTMAFAAPSVGSIEDVSAGDHVRFEFRERDGDYELTSIGPAQ